MQNKSKLHKICFFISLLLTVVCGKSFSQPSALDNIPELLSNIKINVDNTTDNDFLFFAPYNNGGYIAILNPVNEIVFYNKVGNFGARDFKMHANGLMSYLSGESDHFIILNDNLQVIDSVQCKNDLETNFHDFQILDDGKYCLLCRGRNIKDFSALGGAEIHEVVDPVIQIQDSLHQVIYEWKSAPHFEGDYIIDVLDNFNPSGSLKNYIHLNSIEIDSLNNFLISSRFQSQVSYVDKNTGEVLWRLGGKQSEFTFANDPGFSDQHSPRWTAENRILLFDNSCFAEKVVSRAVEYELDFENKIATKIWEYVRPDSLHTQGMGNTQRLENGNTLTSWGDAGLEPLRIIEVNPKSEIVFDLCLDSLNYNYAAYKFAWPSIDSTETSIHEPANSIFQIFPNPSLDYFNLLLNKLTLNKISICNIQGQTVYHSQINQLESKHIHGLDKGLYILNLYSKNNLSLSEKLIIH